MINYLDLFKHIFGIFFLICFDVEVQVFSDYKLHTLWQSKF